ncbi:MAG: DHH family phosphoesterase [Planctomycetes bacterium]|jgi:nanoRNase/pAp phosphatase (c-di-AMP/oligoRNAs hydrolase)|nr:DHH family phosphoesterase [Planctomycetota bacterium]
MDAGDLPFDLEAALAGLRGKSRALILTHNNPDPDALASAEALRVLLAKGASLPATVGYGGIVGRAENRTMIRLLGIPTTPLRHLRIRDFDVVALVDTQPGSGNHDLPPDRAPDVVVDHHPRRERTASVPWADVREEAGATSTILHGYVRRRGIELDSRLATALFYGIASDTMDLGREATPDEQRAYLDLLPRADFRILAEIRTPDLSYRHYKVLTQALEAVRVHGRRLAAVNLGPVPYPEIPAEMADFFLRAQGIRVSFATGLFGTDLFVSLRTLGEEYNAGVLVRQVVQTLGQAGGHRRAAGGLVGMVPPENSVRLGESLTRRLVSFLGLPAESGRLIERA